MSARHADELSSYWRTCDVISAQEDDFESLRNIRTVLDNIIRFYERIQLRFSADPAGSGENLLWPLKTHRWNLMIERARTWRSRAEDHDWSEDMKIQPEKPEQEVDWTPADIWALCTAADTHMHTVETNNPAAFASMNSYLIRYDMPGTSTTDMPVTSTTTCVDRAISFYRQLCHELLQYAGDTDVVCYLTVDAAHRKLSFSNAYIVIDKSDKKTEFEKRLLLQRWKTLLSELIVFYEEDKLKKVPRTYSGDVVKWRWDQLWLRARRWRETGDKYDFKDCLCMTPIYEEPWWDSLGRRHAVIR